MICLFTISGASGLIYQVVWSRLIVLIFGSATYAVATVLGVFFFGLALGSYLAGRYAPRFSRQLALYGYLEIGVGVYAGIFFVLLSAVQGLHSLVFLWVYESEGMLTLVRIFLSGLLLLPPTILMGATLPVISALLTRSPRHVGQDFGIDSAAQLLSFFYLDAEAVHNYLRGVDEVNSDNHPIIEYTAPKYLLTYQRAGAFYDIFKNSLRARLPLSPTGRLSALENDRIRQRIPYYRRWGIPEHVIQQMIEAHGA